MEEKNNDKIESSKNKEENNNEPKQPKPYFNCSWFLYLSLIGIGYLLNYELFDIFSIGSYLYMNKYAFIIGSLLGGYLAAVLVYGLSKFIAAKILKMKIMYASFFGLRFANRNGKIKASFGIPDGLGVYVRMVPTSENMNYKKYLKSGMYGSIVYALLMIGAIMFTNFGLKDKQATFFLMIMAFFVPFIVVAYQVRYRTDTFNDGFTLKLLASDRTKKFYYTNAKNELAIYSKEGDIQFQDIESDDYNPIVLQAYKYNYYYVFDHGTKEEFEKLCDEIIEKQKYIVEREIIELAYIGKFYCICLTADFDKANDYYWQLTSSERRILTSKSSLESIKTAIYISAFMDTSYEVYSSVKRAYARTKETYPYFGRVDKEVECVEKAISFIEAKYPEWKDE